MPATQPLAIVAGVLAREDGRVLVCTRPAGRAMAGFQEFPGGKRESGEGRWEALARELREELDVRPTAGRPLIRLRHDYPDGPRVDLDFWRVEAWQGQVRALEGQGLAWQQPAELDPAAMLAANRPVVTALRLPSRYLVTPEAPAGQETSFLETLEASLERRPAILVQLRGRWLSRADGAWAEQAVLRARHRGARVLINGDGELARRVGADGVHCPATQLEEIPTLRASGDFWIGASCHDAGELARAAERGADFATLGHLQSTPSHPDQPPLGWAAFRELVHEAGLPVYGIGGLGEADLRALHDCGAQGYAAIRDLWAGSREAPQGA